MISRTDSPLQQIVNLSKMRRYAVICAILWTVLLSGLLVVEAVNSREAIHKIGRITAQSSIEKDLLFRRWASRHGGVYVPESTSTPANHYLEHILERDIVTPSGKHLTLVNPAYMSRQIFELAREQPNLPQGHITSLKPIRPENTPDPWETKALKALEQGAKEVVEPVLMNGQPYLRYMRQLMTENSCLKCHAAQGYKDGDIRGGISATLSLVPIQKAMNNELMGEAFLYSFIWLLGLGFIWFGTRKLGSTMTLLQESEEKHRILFLNSPDAYLIIRDDIFADCNRAAEVMLRGVRAQIVGQPPESISPEFQSDGLKSTVAAKGRIKSPLSFGNNTFEWVQRRFDGSDFFVEVSVASMQLQGETVLFTTWRDLTDQKNAEQEKETALALVKKLEGIIPICMYCKKIRDDQESWHQLEAYICEHSEAQFSHGMCPDCFAARYPD
ncbi:MAG: c-type heme family protein [Desulfuromonadaceae bacterium]